MESSSEFDGTSISNLWILIIYLCRSLLEISCTKTMNNSQKLERILKKNIHVSHNRKSTLRLTALWALVTFLTTDSLIIS